MPYQVAKDIMAYCTSCKMNLVHVIAALDGERIVRVLCKSCKKEHGYHSPKGVKVPSAGRKSAKPPARNKTTAGKKEWEKAVEQGREQLAKVYTMEGIFDVGDKLNHATFGIGFIKELIKPNKMEVLFEDGPKVLVRGLKRP